MMNKTKDIYLKGSKRAVLLLHSFTSNANEMRDVAKHLHPLGYTCYAPNYTGHGATPEQFFESSIEDVWQSAQNAFHFLQQEGYEDIFLVGQSLGGVIALRLANEPACKALVVISAPLLERPIDGLEQRVRSYTERHFHFQQKSKQWIADYVALHFPRPTEKMRALQQFIVDTQSVLPMVQRPICLFKGRLDDDVYQQSIDFIESNVLSTYKEKWTYEESGHLLTLGKERKKLNIDIASFLQKF
ncbi:alpha/beta hydrolase [Kurthia senegalensis]|uniref:alpha/beta hydrolase n=1 Tax=Kurthia senegalensis TaxID=1033740 RepID=UPI00028A3845|nr:alpha/beta fold hydrolase [Kurthia senegalensis]